MDDDDSSDYENSFFSIQERYPQGGLLTNTDKTIVWNLGKETNPKLNQKDKSDPNRVLIIDETKLTKDISKRRRKKSTRLRKPLQNDDLLKNYFEFDKVSSSKDLTTFKIMQPNASPSESEYSSTPSSSESFITKEIFQVLNPKHSESRISGKSNSSSPPELQTEILDFLPKLTFNQLMDSQMLNDDQHISNTLSNTATLIPSSSIIPVETHPKSSNPETVNETAFNFSKESHNLPENFDLLQLLRHFTDTSGFHSNENANIRK